MTDLDAKITEALTDAIGKAILGKTATQGAVDAAAAVLALMKPAPLVWRETSEGFWRAETFRGCYEVYGEDGDWWAMLMVAGRGSRVTIGRDTSNAAKSAAQGCADAVWLASLPIAGLIGVKP